MAEEERFTRKKHDSGFPKLAIDFVLAQGQISAQELDWVVFYEKPFLKFERTIKSALRAFPFAPAVFIQSIRNLLLDKIWIKHLIADKLQVDPAKILFSNHHLSHASSAFFCSPYEKSAILTIDGVGEWTTATLGLGEGKKITILEEINFPKSLGLFYSAFTAFLGFEVNEGEYKVMGMAPYGRPKFIDEVKQTIEIQEDGSFKLNMDYFVFDRSLKKTFSKKFEELFGEPRDPKSKFFTRATGWPSYFGPKPQGQEYENLAKTQEHYADIAASLQAVFEEAVIKLAQKLHQLTGLDRLCLAGGGGLNSVANWKIIEQTPFKEAFIQPAAGDGGGALGAALAVYHIALGQERKFELKHAYYGKSYSLEEIKDFLEKKHIKYEFIGDENKLIERVVDRLLKGEVVGWFQGRFEWGPRALGNRSILADAGRAEMKDLVNTKIKFREPYRPFAPSVLAEQAQKIFEMPDAKEHLPARFMLYVVPVKKEKQLMVPAITHVDGSARPQLVFKNESERYWKLIDRFYQKTNVPLVLNTSFNLKGEPIVSSPDDALSTLARSGLDLLVLENFVVKRSDLSGELIDDYLKRAIKPPKAKRSWQWLKKIGILLVSIFVTLAVLEIAVRIFSKPIYPILRTDAEVGTIHQKNFSGKLWNDEAQKETYIVTNSIGYIGKDYTLAKPTGVARLAFLGDSMTEGLQVDYFNNFTSLLEKTLAVDNICQDKTFQVMNYGVGGSGTFLQYQTYKKNVASYQPDMVIVMFHPNDFSDNLNKINFDLENYKQAQSRNIPLKSFLLNFQLPKYLFNKLQNSPLFLSLLNKLGLYEFNNYTEKIVSGNAQTLRQDPQYYNFTFQIIEKFKAAAQANGSKFIVAVMPDELDYETADKWEQNPDIKELIDYLNAQGIASFNPSSDLAAIKLQKGGCLTFSCAGHLTETGHEAMASWLYKFLKETLPRSYNICKAL